MKKEDVFALLEPHAIENGFDPYLGLAIVEQESTYREDVARPEQGFYHRYTMPDSLATTTEILLASSYGLMQLMGQSLRELGYFDFFVKFYNEGKTAGRLTVSLSEVSVPKALNALMVRPAWQVEWGCKWFKKKLAIAKGDTTKALQFWNGGGNPKYASEVLARYAKLKPLRGS